MNSQHSQAKLSPFLLDCCLLTINSILWNSLKVLVPSLMMRIWNVLPLHVWSAGHMHRNSKGMHSLYDCKCCSLWHSTCSLLKNSAGVSLNICKASFCILRTSRTWRSPGSVPWWGLEIIHLCMLIHRSEFSLLSKKQWSPLMCRSEYTQMGYFWYVLSEDYFNQARDTAPQLLWFFR